MWLGLFRGNWAVGLVGLPLLLPASVPTQGRRVLPSWGIPPCCYFFKKHSRYIWFWAHFPVLPSPPFLVMCLHKETESSHVGSFSSYHTTGLQIKFVNEKKTPINPRAPPPLKG